MGTKTGTGGFDLDVDGSVKTHVFDVGDPNAPGLDPIEPDNGDITVDHTSKDISKKTKTTLAKYLKSITKDNAYPMDGKLVDARISDANGAPETLPEDPTNDSQFYTGKRSAEPGIAGSVAVVPADKRPAGLDGWLKGTDGSTSVLRDPTGELTGKLSKGRPYDKKSDGNSLLSSVSKDKLPEPIKSYVTSVLSNNRFTNDNPLTHADLNSTTSRQNFNPTYRIRGKAYTQNQLAQVGPMLSLRGSQEFPAAFNNSVDPTGAGAVAGALIPSPNQIGVLKVNNLLLEARDALEHIDGELDPDAQIEISSLGNQSWGSLNNVEEPFNGLLNIGMVAMALAMQVALTLAFEGLGALISLLGGGGSKVAPGKKKNGAYIKGHFLSPPSAPPMVPSITDLLGIKGTIFPFGDALSAGSVAFFIGADKAKEGLGSQIASALEDSLGNLFSNATSTGHLIIISRLIIRTGQSIAAAVSSIGSAFAANPVSGIKAIIGLLEVIRSSKLIAAINVFTMIGDAVLSEGTADDSPDGEEHEKGPATVEALTNDAPGASAAKSRLQGTLKLAWSSNRVPTSYLLPDSIVTMQMIDSKLGAFKGALGSTDEYSKSYNAIQKADDRIKNGARIPRDSAAPSDVSVKTIEAMLDSEYMPFYFHDLRTNEIIGFQAFLASLNDDYTASWESPDGYGRVDPVKIYKNTTRRISMSFYVAALDRKDFDDMWVKVNKLVTLLYPQYTRGRLMSDGNNTFVQPFSQLIGASPVIRIRLGDLLRSNYSRFALARLFGAGDGDMMLDGAPIKFEGAADAIKDPASKKFIASLLSTALNDPASVYQVKVGGWPSGPPPSTGMAIPLPSGPSTPDQAPTFNVDAGDLRYFKMTTTSADVDKIMNRASVKVEQYTPSELAAMYGMNIEDATTKFKQIGAYYGTSNNIKKKVLGGEGGYVVPLTSLYPDSPTLTKLLSKVSSGLAAAVPNIDSLSAFLDIEKNALVKSFRAIQGKGLAGVIETMNFDWYDKATWETEPNARAPKMCKVTLTFSPIHDVSPGIDHMGYNRAPVYPVGDGMGHGFDPDTTG